MFKQLKIEWHKLWFITYNTLLGSTSSSILLVTFYKKSKYHSSKLLQLL